MSGIVPLPRFKPGQTQPLQLPVLHTVNEIPSGSEEAHDGGSIASTEIDDDTPLTVGLLRREMNTSFNKFAQGLVGHINQQLKHQNKTRDDQ